MSNTLSHLISAAAMAIALATSPALADGPVADRGQSAENAVFEQDRQTILAMAGDYRVRFDMQESTPWLEGYEPLDPKVSGGHESVRVVEDTGTRIVLQHLLVVDHEGENFVIKHWRQDWEYEPTQILTYDGPNAWVWSDVPERMRHGRWSQTVYQVDDSPRYAGWGQWEVTNGVHRWRSNWTTRPLARRDATRNPIYDRYQAINRHQLTPTGWIHWQDNTKMMPDPDGQAGQLVPVVQEYVLNTYEHFSDYNVSAADDYWAATSTFWAQVRAKWDAVAATKGGIFIEEEAQTGTVIAGQLLDIANQVHAGELPQDAAIAQALSLIEGATHTR